MYLESTVHWIPLFFASWTLTGWLICYIVAWATGVNFFYLKSQFEFLGYSSINFYEFLRPHRPYLASHFNVRCAVA